MMTRRDFLHALGLSSLGWIAACAINPVTGRNQLMLVSEDWEVQVDRSNSPQQFSTDYGALQDAALNRYVQEVGGRMAPHTHRPRMPYSFRGVNATYINAYAFPGGSIAATRGILLSLDNEAQLAALLGHELGHVNARHTAQQMSKGMVTQTLVQGLGALAGSAGDLASQLGMVGAGAFLASYSRDNEREADHLGMTYMVKGGYSPQGMVQLMAMLNTLHQGKPEAASLLFATHPMSQERYDTAVQLAGTEFAAAKGLPLHRERYMDETAGLRRIKPAVDLFERGSEAMGAGAYPKAEAAFNQGLALAPADYAGLTMMAKCQLVQKKNEDALRFLERAKQAYPAEAQARYLAGLAQIRLKKFDAALAEFDAYDTRLPGNPSVFFYRGYAYEGMGQRRRAAEAYNAYLQRVNEGDMATYARQRLAQWRGTP